jgi:uncharacterized damage-inducible protein DinB
MTPQVDATADNIAFLRQGIALLKQLNGDLFTSTSGLCPGGTVGAHFRHCVDFYLSFVHGVASGKIDYNDRERNLQLETAPERAVEAFEQVVARLESNRGLDRHKTLSVKGDGSGAGEDGWSQSTVGRELQFLHSHTIHHFALVGFMLRANGFEVDATFGVAPSTLRHWENTATRAS